MTKKFYSHEEIEEARHDAFNEGVEAAAAKLEEALLAVPLVFQRDFKKIVAEMRAQKL